MPERDMRCGVIVIPYGDHLGGDPVISMYGLFAELRWPVRLSDIIVYCVL